MLIRVRTTLIIDDNVFAASKRRAIEEGVTLSDLTTEALREALRKKRTQQPSGHFVMPVFGGTIDKEYSPSDLAALRDDGL